MEYIQNDHIYYGEENVLILSQTYTTSFTCKYDMGAYPFDVQKCSMIFVLEVNMFNPRSVEKYFQQLSDLQGNSGYFAQLIKDELKYLGSIDLLQYFVKGAIHE